MNRRRIAPEWNRPSRLVVPVPDTVLAGVQGTNQLRLRSERQCICVKTLVLPSGITDLRACVQETKNADWLAGQIGKLTQQSPKQGAASNDDAV